MTVVLIKEIWAAIERGRDLGMGGKPANMIPNIKVYSLARRGLHFIKDEPQAALIDVLLLWFDEMMRRLCEGEPFSARDAIGFLGGTGGLIESRRRRRSI